MTEVLRGWARRDDNAEQLTDEEWTVVRLAVLFFVTPVFGDDMLRVIFRTLLTLSMVTVWMKTPALNALEFIERTILRNGVDADLECASMESSGTLNLWNGRGESVEVSKENANAVAALLLQGRIRQQHADALLRVMNEQADRPTHRALMDLFEEITFCLPPKGCDSETGHKELLRLTEVEFLQDEEYSDTRASRMSRGRPCALMWTLNKEHRFTSLTGPALSLLCSSILAIRETRPALEDVVPADSPLHHSLLLALQGQSVRFVSSWAGYEWEGTIQPLKDEAGKVVGCVGYATTEKAVMEGVVAPLTEIPAPVNLLLAANGNIMQGNLDALVRTYCPDIPFAEVPRDWLSAIHLISTHVCGDAHVYVKNSMAMLTVDEPTTETITLTGNRRIHRYTHPLKDEQGVQYGVSVVVRAA